MPCTRLYIHILRGLSGVLRCPAALPLTLVGCSKPPAALRLPAPAGVLFPDRVLGSLQPMRLKPLLILAASAFIRGLVLPALRDEAAGAGALASRLGTWLPGWCAGM